MLCSVSDYQKKPVEISKLRSLACPTTNGCFWKRCDFYEAYLGKLNLISMKCKDFISLRQSACCDLLSW